MNRTLARGTARGQWERVIARALESLPYQLANFDEFKADLASRLCEALPGWTSDLQGPAVELIDIAAVVLDCVSFYEERLADESFMATCSSDTARLHAALLGYVPSPPTAQLARIALDVSERVRIERDQIFEGQNRDGETLRFTPTAAESMRPERNRVPLRMQLSARTYYGDQTDHLLFERRGFRVRVGDVVFVRGGSTAAFVTDVSREGQWFSVQLSHQVEIPSDLIQVQKFRDVTSLEIDHTSEIGSDGSYSLTLPGFRSRGFGRLAYIRSGDDRAHLTSARTGSARYTFGIGEAASSVAAMSLQFFAGATDGATPTTNVVRLYHDAGSAGTVVVPPSKSFTGRPVFEFDEPYGATTADGYFVGSNGKRVYSVVTINDEERTLRPNEELSLRLPAVFRGNVVEVEQGEPKRSAIGVGSGLPNQTFEIPDKPVTCYPTPSKQTSHGLRTSLSIWIDDVRWAEVPTLLFESPDAQVYRTETDELGTTTVIFGDGTSGAIVTAGANVVADYKVGAGTKSARARRIDAMTPSVTRVSNIENPEPTFSGSDGEDGADTRRNAPRTATLFGRCVSARDIERTAMQYPGVYSATASNGVDQVFDHVTVMIASEQPIEDALSEYLLPMCDPSLRLTVLRAKSTHVGLAFNIDIEPEFDPAPIIEKVGASVREYLSPNSISVGGRIIRSRVYERVMSVQGVVGVSAMALFGSETIIFDDFASFQLQPDEFPAAEATVFINGVRA